MLAEQPSCIKFWAPSTLNGLYGVFIGNDGEENGNYYLGFRVQG